jgi:hypothetical protein
VIAAAADAAFKDVLNVKEAAELVDGLGLELFGGGGGDDPELGGCDASEFRDGFNGEAGDKFILLRIAGDVAERAYEEAGLLSRAEDRRRVGDDDVGTTRGDGDENGDGEGPANFEPPRIPDGMGLTSDRSDRRVQIGVGCERRDEFFNGLEIGVDGSWVLWLVVRLGIDLRLALAEPFVELRAVGVDGRKFADEKAADRETVVLLPALNGANFPMEIRGDFAPGFEPRLVTWRIGQRAIERRSSRHLVTTE